MAKAKPLTLSAEERSQLGTITRTRTKGMEQSGGIMNIKGLARFHFLRL